MSLVLRTAVDEVNLREAFRRPGSGMDVMTAKVAPEVESFVDWEISEVLAAEGDDLALGDEAGELVFAGVGEGAQLDAADFCPDGGSEVCDLCALGEEVFVRSIGILPVFVMLELGQWRVLLVRVPSG